MQFLQCIMEITGVLLCDIVASSPPEFTIHYIVFEAITKYIKFCLDLKDPRD